jgi:hypothetical protein
MLQLISIGIIKGPFISDAHLKGDKFFSVGECFGYLPKETTGFPPTCSTRVIEGISFEVRATIWKDDDCINL